MRKKLEHARTIRAECLELLKIAKAAKFPLLVRLLDMAALEAVNQEIALLEKLHPPTRQPADKLLNLHA